MEFKMLICALASTLAIGAAAEAQRGGGNRTLTFYSATNYSGQSVTIDASVTNFQTVNFNDRALSIRIQGGGSWTVCQHSSFRGVCRSITSDVSNLATISLDGHISSARMEQIFGQRPGGGLSGGGRGNGGGSSNNNASLTFYSERDFGGQSVTVNGDVENMQTVNFNDRALSVQVEGRGSWTVCQDSNFRGVCREISSDVYDLATISLDGHISSVRREYGSGGRQGGGRSGGGRSGNRRGDGSLTLYAGPNFTGQSINIDRETYNLTSLRFNDRAMSAEVEGRGRWTICEDANYGSPCRTISGRVANLNSYGLGNRVTSARPEGDNGGGYGGNGGGYDSRAGTLVLFSGPNFTGQSLELDREESNFVRLRFNDQAMSAIAYGNESWTVCEDTNFGTPCRSISGRVRNLNSLGLGNRISSARPDYGYSGNGGGYGGPGGNPGGGYGGRDGTLVLFSGPNFTGRSVELSTQENNLTRQRFNDQAMSAIVYGNGSWTVCEDANFGTPCREVSGRIPNLNAYRLGNLITSARPNPIYGQPGSGYGGPGGGGYNQYESITLYAGPNFTGQSVTLDRDTYNMDTARFNDRAMSLTVNGRGSWIVCEHTNYNGRCQQVDRDIANLNQWGLGNRISSARRN